MTDFNQLHSALNARFQRPVNLANGAGSIFGDSGDIANVNNQANDSLQAAYGANGINGGGSAGPLTAEQAQQKEFADTEGRGASIMSDPYTQAALDRLKGVTDGTDVPYTQQVQNQLLTKQGDANASAESSQAEMLRNQMTANGGSMSDPSAMAAMRQLEAQRQTANNGALGDIQTQATMNNFNARNQGATSMASVRGQQNAQANQMYGQAAELANRVGESGQHQNAVQSFMPQSMGGGYQVPNYAQYNQQQSQQQAGKYTGNATPGPAGNLVSQNPVPDSQGTYGTTGQGPGADTYKQEANAYTPQVFSSDGQYNPSYQYQDYSNPMNLTFSQQKQPDQTAYKPYGATAIGANPSFLNY